MFTIIKGVTELPKNEDIIAGIAALFLGLVGLAILASIFGPRCPRCGRPIQRGVKICPHCGTRLEW
jgi:uncharacterized Zn finger protein (UPF0148 family)